MPNADDDDIDWELHAQFSESWDSGKTWVPGDVAFKEHLAALRKPVAPKKLDRNLDSVNRAGCVLVAYVSSSHLLPMMLHSVVLKLIREIPKKYGSLIHIIYGNFQEQKIPRPEGLMFVPSFYLFKDGKRLSTFEFRSGRETHYFWDWLDRHIGR